MPRSYSTSFVYNFKRGDNIARNGETLALLWKIRSENGSKEAKLLNKPVVVLCASIIEACLCELFHRIRYHTIEGVPRLTEKQIRGVRKTKKDEFDFYIKQCRQNALLGTRSSDVYHRLDALRELRNRIHIQNLGGVGHADEAIAFSSDEVIEAEKLLEYVLAYLSKHYPRSHCYTDDIVVLWDHGTVV